MENYKMEKTLELKNVKVIFADIKDRGYGRNIVIDATDSSVQSAISQWVEDNKINGGEAKFKDYTNEKTGETTKQYTFKISEYTQFEGKDDLNENNLGRGAIINLAAAPFEYNNKFGTGVSASLKAVYIKQGSKSIMDSLRD